MRSNNNKIQSVLDDFIDEAKSIYGRDLKKVILFGSYARNEQNPDADIDLITIVRMSKAEIAEYDQELKNASKEITSFYGITVHPIALAEEEYEHGKDKLSLYQEIHSDGKILYTA